jgi:transposase
VFEIAFKKLGLKKRRYPVKQDSYGRSARRRAFEAFDDGKKPAEVAGIIRISKKTARRYFADWKKLPHDLEITYRLLKPTRRGTPEFFPETIKSLSAYLGMTEEEVLERLDQPWGLKQLLMGRWPNHHQERERTEAEVRLQAALMLIHMLESVRVPPKKVLEQLLRMKADITD